MPWGLPHLLLAWLYLKIRVNFGSYLMHLCVPHLLSLGLSCDYWLCMFWIISLNVLLGLANWLMLTLVLLPLMLVYQAQRNWWTRSFNSYTFEEKGIKRKFVVTLQNNLGTILGILNGYWDIPLYILFVLFLVLFFI